MTTVRDICTRALTRLGMNSAGETPSASDVSDALDALNDMLFGWQHEGVPLEHEAFVLDDTFFFLVPPRGVTGTLIAALDYQGTWNASTNSPTLASSDGTAGYWYRVSTAGSTTLDDVTSWSVDDAAVYDGADWLKGQSSRGYEGGVVAMLAVRLAEDYGVTPGPILHRDAASGWAAILAAFFVPPAAQFEGAIIRTPGRRYFEGTDEV